MTKPIVTISFFKFNGTRNRFWAFAAMGKSSNIFANIKGLTFYKLMGSGGKNGFGIWPNFGVYAFLGNWQTENDATQFQKSAVFQEFIQKSNQSFTLKLEALTSHGTWDGTNPFPQNDLKITDNEPVAVITRGKIKVSKLIKFWRNVKPASHNIDTHEGLIFSIGIGEQPLIQQCTFSIWESSLLMKQYAYKSKQHTEVIKKTRDLGWYSEELFARFRLVEPNTLAHFRNFYTDK